MFRFSIYSTDNLNPDLALDSTSWGPDPINGEYNDRHAWEGRGSHVRTLKGVKHQDQGLNIEDRQIRIAGSDFTDELRAEIQTKYEALDTVFNFTDGLGEVFNVRFSRRPRGFSPILNTPLWAKGIMLGFPPPPKYKRYGYEILLFVTAQVL